LEIAVLGTFPVAWKLVVGQALTAPTFADVNATYSSSEALAGAGTLSGTPALVLAQGVVNATGSNKTTAARSIGDTVPITLDQAGLVRNLGTLTVLVAGIGGTSSTQATLNWRELR
jgi:hypothetical protein